MPADQWDDLGLAAAAILTAIGTLIGVIFTWAKWRREVASLRAELQPSEAGPPGPARAIPDAAMPPGTTRDVVDSSHQLLLHVVTQLDSLTQTDGRIEAWGKTEHARLDVRIDDLGEELRFELGAHEERLTALEAVTTPIGGTD